MQAIFIDNLQMGFVANEIIDRCSELAETAFQLDSSMRLVQLNASISDDLHARILAVFQEPKVVRDALVLIPLEPLDALKAIMSLMSSDISDMLESQSQKTKSLRLLVKAQFSPKPRQKSGPEAPDLLINPLWFLIFPMNRIWSMHTPKHGKTRLWKNPQKK